VLFAAGFQSPEIPQLLFSYFCAPNAHQGFKK